MKIKIQITGNCPDSKNLSFVFDSGNDICTRDGLEHMFLTAARCYNTLNSDEFTDTLKATYGEEETS
jgi:hypothetical protein